jgi:hypothetical protein
MKLTITILVLLFLGGCASSPSILVPQKVSIAVPVSCISDDVLSKIQSPTFQSDSELLGGSSYQVPLNLWIDHIERSDYILKLESVISSCK